MIWDFTIDITYSTILNQDMQKSQALTVPSLIKAMKMAGFTTKDDLKGLRQQIRDDQDEARAEFFQNMTLPTIERVVSKAKIELTTKIESVESNLTQEIDGVKAELSETPSISDFKKLQKQVTALG